MGDAKIVKTRSITPKMIDSRFDTSETNKKTVAISDR